MKDASAEFCATTTQSDVLIAPRNTRHTFMDLSKATMFSNRVMKVSSSVRQSRGVREYTTRYTSQHDEALGVLHQLAGEKNHDIVGEKLQNWSTRRRLMK